MKINNYTYVKGFCIPNYWYVEGDEKEEYWVDDHNCTIINLTTIMIVMKVVKRKTNENGGLSHLVCPQIRPSRKRQNIFLNG